MVRGRLELCVILEDINQVKLGVAPLVRDFVNPLGH